MTATWRKSFVLVVAAALVDPDGRVLIAQRPEARAWQGYGNFRAARSRRARRRKTALIRELAEELGIAVKEPCLAPFTFASHTYGEFHLLMPLYICRRWDGTPRPLEHAALKWVRPRDLLARQLSHARGRLAAYSHAARSLVKSFAADTGGATAIEYALIASLISMVIIAALTTIGTKLSHSSSGACAGNSQLAFHRRYVPPCPAHRPGRALALPGFSGCCWLSCGAQPVR